jgi:hypothetical protein
MNNIQIIKDILLYNQLENIDRITISTSFNGLNIEFENYYFNIESYYDEQMFLSTIFQWDESSEIWSLLEDADTYNIEDLMSYVKYYVNKRDKYE